MKSQELIKTDRIEKKQKKFDKLKDNYWKRIKNQEFEQLNTQIDNVIETRMKNLEIKSKIQNY